MFRVPIYERNRLVLYVRFGNCCSQKCVPFDNKRTCFCKKRITEQNGPLVLKWNQLFRVPNSEGNNLVLYVRFENCCSQKCVPFDNKRTCFCKKRITEQNGPLVLKWNHLFPVPNSERNNLALFVRFKNCCS